MIDNFISNYLPVLATLIVSVIVLWSLHWLLLARHKGMGAKARLPRQISLFVMTLLAILILIILFPMSDSTRGQVITLMGLVITGVIALASTSFVANVMAGLMLNVVKSFSPGDFIRVGDQFGRVTERGLFHTEIQTEDRDLATLPNLSLATNAVTVVHSTGTIISAELSLGYDLSRLKIEELLKEAATRVELQEPFVLVMALHDFSVVYRVCGFLSDVSNLITKRSMLKKMMLDVMHENDIEIVSPAFMYQRQQPEWNKVIPVQQAVDEVIEDEVAPEEIIFDKARVAAETEDVRGQLDVVNNEIALLSKQKKAASKDEKDSIDLLIKMAVDQRQELMDELEGKDD